VQVEIGRGVAAVRIGRGLGRGRLEPAFLVFDGELELVLTNVNDRVLAVQ